MGIWFQLSRTVCATHWVVVLFSVSMLFQLLVFIATYHQNSPRIRLNDRMNFITLSRQNKTWVSPDLNIFYLGYRPLLPAANEKQIFKYRLNTSKRLSTGSEDLNFPLEIDMPELVRREFANLSVHTKPINLPGFRYKISNHEKCTRLTAQYGKPPELLVLIKTAPINFIQRDAIRLSWGNERCWGGRRVVRLFLLGSVLPSQQELSKRLASESIYHKDIVQQDFIDQYHNNTYKLMLGFDWAVRFCPSVPLIMFVDDDFFVYPENVVAYVEGLSLGLRERLISGYVWRNAIPVRNKRDKRSQKWLITWKEYPNSYYPPYVAAGNFFVSMHVAKEINIAAKYTQYLRFDDVFLGIIIKKLVRTPIHLYNIYAFLPVNTSSAEVQTMISSHEYGNPASQFALWDQLKCNRFCVK